MKNSFAIFIFFLFGFYTHAQTSTEIYVFDLNYVDGKIVLSNPINISDNEGYDSQPFFLPNADEILFSSNRNGQTDLVKYSLKTNQKEWLINTSASEYSPKLTPKNNAVSYIKLEENGTQLLWSFDLKTQKESILIPDLKIGYHVWFDENTLISFVLGEPNTLQISDLNSKTHKIVSENIGRSLHKIPNQNLVSFVSKKENIWTINSLNPKSG
ncbi:MAG: steroid delta-isomerase, partial [Flavobacteriaceae bacterium]|nr:steroid delta-isomerase [Flavobacteriaceae bacterium]